MGKFAVYLAGKITGNENYRSEFIKAEWKAKELLGDNILILNPAVLPMPRLSGVPLSCLKKTYTPPISRNITPPNKTAAVFFFIIFP